MADGSIPAHDDAAGDTNTAPFNARTLELREVGPDTFLSVDLWQPLGNRGVFGGQVIGQALAAAAKTVDGPYQCNSLHCYFLAAGVNTEMIAYEVRRIRQGTSYSTRVVMAKQSGRIIFVAMASFQRPEASPLDHQYAMPDVPGPEALISQEERLRRRQARLSSVVIDQSKIDEYSMLPVEARTVPTPAEQRGLPVNAVWLRARGDMSGLGHVHHQSMLAYASDFALLGSTARPYHMDRPGSRYQLSMMVSLDHTIWFHAPFRADEWLLYVIESPRAASGRGLGVGRIYSRDGVLVASTAQEGVVRGTDRETDHQTFEFVKSLAHAPKL
ncbi:acyl-CoA thioesterase [Coemansia biformis]|uniref:Acyl-CoA thioesterase n=1 Tax=Coemansia biformis TaxID=1286918 RepID=A0A9W7YBC7_9FUNG|nr:acyl-CoA thioesterase [Coemansia biformis]